MYKLFSSVARSGIGFLLHKYGDFADASVDLLAKSFDADLSSLRISMHRKISFSYRQSHFHAQSSRLDTLQQTHNKEARLMTAPKHGSI